LFNWQDVVAGMIALNELEVELAVAESFLRRKVESGELVLDHSLELGQRVYHYFQRERVDSIREQFHLTKVDDSTIKRLFLDYCAEMDMSASYKPVLMLAILDSVDHRGKASVHSVVDRFRQFYEDRRQAGLPIEKPNMRMSKLQELDNAALRRVIFGMPFEKFERRQFLKYDRDLAYIRIATGLWKQLRKADLAAIRLVCEESIAKYYERL
jgi:hypothetical protein